MLIKFNKDQKWKIGASITSFKEGETKEVKDTSIAKSMIEHDYGVEVDESGNLVEKKAVEDYENKAIEPDENKDNDSKEDPKEEAIEEVAEKPRTNKDKKKNASKKK